jgi:hypothetical protein
MRLEEVGKQVDQAVSQAAARLERETERLIAYLNDEVVPAVRRGSSRQLRNASQKLSRFADYLESKRPR